MKKHEIRSLPDDLKARAIAIEHAAKDGLCSVQGLGRSFSWESFLTHDAPDMFGPEIDTPCGCYDGDATTPDPDESEARHA